MREEEADPVVVFRNGGRMGGNKNPTREGSFPLGILQNGNEVADLVDSSLMGKRMGHLLLSRGNTGLSLAKYLGVLVLAFPPLKPTATSWPGRSVLGSAFPRLFSRLQSLYPFRGVRVRFEWVFRNRASSTHVQVRPRISHNSAYAAYQGGQVLWYGIGRLIVTF